MARNKEGQRRYYAEYYQANRARIRAQQSAYRVANRSKIQRCCSRSKGGARSA